MEHQMWTSIGNWIRQESAAVQALIQSFVALGIAFEWWHWSDAQTGAVIGIVGALLSMFVRSQVTPIIRPMAAGRPLIPDPHA
jgi:Na+/H+ antiporter NhaC